MRIKDLLESYKKDFKEFVDPEKGLLYNLAEDLVFFMNNDDETYRQHVYPSLAKCIGKIEQNRKIDPLIFKTPALESYKKYRIQFPINELPQSLDDETLNEVCHKYYEELCKHHEEGKFKD